MKKFQHGRHTSAFILLFLAEEPAYGGMLLKMLDKNLPFNTIDSAILYRKLKNLEKEGAIQAFWDTSTGNKPVKWYKLTDKGETLLAEFYKDILLRQKNLAFFLEQYQKLKEDQHD